jgi:hypothetical protein
VPLLAWKDYYNVYLAFWAQFALGKICFHKIKGRETLNRYVNDLSTADTVFSESFSASTKLHKAHAGI